MKSSNKYNKLLNESIKALMKNALSVVAAEPSYTLMLTAMIKNMLLASRRRAKSEKEGLQVPPYSIFSLTDTCNLKCKGCYAQAQDRPKKELISSQRASTLLAEASELGISIMVLAGGEPLTRPELFEWTAQRRDMLFPLFTNGTLIDEVIIEKFRDQKHVIPIISIEGFELQTDIRRGEGVYAKAREVMQRLKDNHVLFGVSLTLTSLNSDLLISNDYIEEILSAGCKLFFFIEYVPVQQGTEGLAFDESMRQSFIDNTKILRAKHSALFVTFPGEEKEFDGCLSSGRGFIHINPYGELEPCPFAPYSDTDINSMTLKNALNSKLLRTLRDNHAMLNENVGGCALWEKRDWVKKIISE